MCIKKQSEVTDINKQKFLAELGKLLTFMYEEDRQTALAMYSRMFELAEDEQALLLFLGSPTRQAVVIARAYNAKERKLQVSAQSREEELGLEPSHETPDFVLAIDEIQREAQAQAQVSFTEEPQPTVDQLSLFELDEQPLPSEPETEQLPEEAPEEESQPLEEPAPQSAESAEEPEQLQIQQADEPESQVEDDVDAFLADFSIAGDEPEAEPEPESAQPQEQEEGIVLMPQDEAGHEEYTPEDYYDREPVRKPRIFLLILFTIIAVPVTLIAVILLLVPMLISLVLAVAAIAMGAGALVAAFAGFAVFADILVMLGAALVILALGLLFLWLFLWFIGGAIVGLIKAVIGLGAKWCYKEVPVE